MVDAKDLDKAISVAERISGAQKGTIEIRPIMESRACRRINVHETN